MRILVVTASKHHATEEIGDAIVEELRAAGHAAQRMAPEAVRSLDGVDAVVLGSAVYMTQWMESARTFAQRFADDLTEMPLYAFSVGLAGVPKGDVKPPESAAAALRGLDPAALVAFKGRLATDALGLRERAVLIAASTPEGDYREWDKVRAFGRRIAAELRQPLEV